MMQCGMIRNEERDWKKILHVELKSWQQCYAMMRIKTPDYKFKEKNIYLTNQQILSPILYLLTNITTDAEGFFFLHIAKY